MPPLKKIKGRYVIKAKLGEGGMSVVYRAYDPPPMDRDVAVKTLVECSDRLALQLFYKECELLKSMSHPNIVDIFDMGEFEDSGAKKPFFVMPLLPGRPLDELIGNANHRLTVERIVEIMTQTCRGLQAAHERGLVHRDLKPSNIFVMEDDSVKIIDFGVAHMVDSRSQSSGFLKGTLLYMAPEQIQFKPVCPQSDIFSLGVVCYEALTRRQPFRCPREEDVIQAILKLIPPPASEINPGVSVVMSRVVHRAMAKHPGHRFSSARELSDALQRAFRNEPIELFDPARIRPRLERAQKAFESGDHQFANEILSELEAEGNIDSAMTLLKANIERAIRQKTISQLLDSAKARFEQDEDPLALQKIQQILELDAHHAAALGLKSKIENRRTEREIDGWIQLAEQYVANHRYGHAREALQRILRIRPMNTRACKLFVELESREQEYLRLCAEKAQIYQNALNCWRHGEVTEALSQMGLVLELDRRAPDTSSAEGGQTYQSFYHTVRSEHDAMNNAYAEARHAIAQQDFEKALAACNVYLTKYPSNTLFQALKFDIEEQRRLRLSAYIAEIDQQLEAEPDLENKVELLRGVLARYPGEPHFERSLRLVTGKRDLVNSIVLRARQYQERGQLNEALADLEIVRTIYGLYPGLAFEIERLEKKREQQTREAAKADRIKRIDRSLELGEYSFALELLANAQQEFAGDSELTELEKLVHARRDRAEQAQQLVLAGQDLCLQGKFDEGLDSLRKAWQLDERRATARNTLVAALVKAGEIAIADDWRRAESLVEEALDLDPFHALANDLRSRISTRKTDEEVGQFVSRARKLRIDGDLDGALLEFKKGLAKYPSEARLIALRETLEQEVAQIAPRRARLRDREEANSISAGASRASTEELESIHERPRAFVVESSREAEFQSVAAEVDRIVEKRIVEEEADRRQPRPRPGKPWLLAAIPKQVRWVAGAVLVLAVVLLTADGWRNRTPALDLVPVQVHVSPPGATVRIDGKTLETSLLVFLPVGHHQVEASLDGYESGSATISITPGGTPPVELTLRPVAQGFRITAPDLEDAEVFLDDRSLGALKGGTFSHASLTPGRHTIRIRFLGAQKQQAVFSFESKPDRPPKVLLPLEAKQCQLLVISSKGNIAFIAGTMLPVSAKLDGSALGTVTPRGLEWTDLQAGDHQLILGEGARARTMSFESGSSPLLNAVIYSDRNHYSDRGEGHQTSPRSPAATGSGRVSFSTKPPPARAEEAASTAPLSPQQPTASGTVDSRTPTRFDTHDLGPRSEFEAAMSSRDPAVLRNFLWRNPSGEYHDRVAERLDDLIWAHTESNDVASLNTYLSRFPGGRHAGQARAQIAALTRPFVPQGNQPKVESTIPAAVDDKSAVLKLVRRYQQAYQNESVDQLKALWPNMGERQIRALNFFFGHARLVKLDCKLIGDPIIAGNYSTLKLTQNLTYLVRATHHIGSSRAQLIMHLRKQLSDSGGSPWRIESIQ